MISVLIVYHLAMTQKSFVCMRCIIVVKSYVLFAAISSGSKLSVFALHAISLAVGFSFDRHDKRFVVVTEVIRNVYIIKDACVLRGLSVRTIRHTIWWLSYLVSITTTSGRLTRSCGAVVIISFTTAA